MGQITSREELDEWLKDKPADWAQVIAARAALRVLPYAFGQQVKSRWLQDFAVTIFRSLTLSWAAHSFTGNMLSIYAATAEAEDAAEGAASIDAGDRGATICVKAAGCAAAAVAAAVSDEPVVNNPVYYASNCVSLSVFSPAFGDIEAAEENANLDCIWLDEYPVGALSARFRVGQALWPIETPAAWRVSWSSATARLLTLDPTYQVWIDWYNRRIEGHDAAFAIPGDSNRTHDKEILARLADATDEDFWDKGATHVNTTLQSWIDEAREQAAIDYVASGAPLKLGSDAELAARDELAARLASVEDALAALKDQLASLTQTGHGGIGHNQPENATSLRDDEIITLKQQVASLETLLTGVQTQLATPVPDVGQLVQDVPKLNRWGRAMCVMADMSSDKVAEGFEKEIGAASARGLINVGKALVYTALCAFLLFFYTVWIPLLID